MPFPVGSNARCRPVMGRSRVKVCKIRRMVMVSIRKSSLIVTLLWVMMMMMMMMMLLRTEQRAAEVATDVQLTDSSHLLCCVCVTKQTPGR